VLTHSRSISAVHAKINIHPSKPRTATLTDCHSMNGSFVNDARVHHDQVPLASGESLG
jgi:hypothetical protein